MILILDYGLGNLRSVANMIRKVTAETIEISDSPEKIAQASRLVIPGVGHFDRGIANLTSRQLVGVLREEIIIKSKPVLGICLGMQLLGETSEEGSAPGLSLV